MKSNSLDALIRLKRFEVEGKRRKVAEIEAMISDFNYIAAELDRQIATEEDRAGVFDVGYYAYPTLPSWRYRDAPIWPPQSQGWNSARWRPPGTPRSL